MMFLCVAIIVSLVGVGSSNPLNVPKLSWPTAYTATGSIVMPYAEINEDFTAYIDMDAKMGRMDTYSATSSIIYNGAQNDYGVMYKLVPVTTNDSYNVPTCFAIPGSKDGPVLPQTILPDPSLYTFAASLDTLGVMIFYSNFTENNKDNSYVLGVNAKDMTPKYLSFTGYDRVFGSHYDQYVINYDTFVPGKPDSGVFKVSNPEKCTGFPGPGNSPMTESLFFEILGADEPYSRGSQTRHIDTAFDSFRDRYNKKYITEKEEMKRRQNFLHNYRFVKSRNSMGLKYTLSLNHLSDLSETEIKRMRGYRNTGINSKFTYMSTVSDIPVYMNWWLRGAVTPVKDQGICGSCWSFGTTGTLEGSNFIKTGKLVALSEQAFVDCSWGQGNNGCDGGESERAYEWLLLGKCLPTERSYRYLMDDSSCHDKQAECGVKISAYYNVMSGNVTDLKAKIYERGPISIAIDASHRSFSFYANGVYYEPKCGNTPDSLDHQVLAVGYGVLNGNEYVLVKNSWSTHWGFDGFVLMSTRDNNCGIATDASFADIA